MSPHDQVTRASGAARARLRREATVLQEYRHPGVAEFVRLDEDDDETRLVTRGVGPRSLTDALTPELDLAAAEIAGVMAATVETVADLHQAGLVHGGLDPSHVALSPDGHPTLTGFGDAGPVGTPMLDPVATEGPWRDPATRRGGERAATTDVHALGATLHALLERNPPPPAPWGVQLLGTEWRVRRRLRAIASWATRGDPAQRPSARALAEAIVAVAPDAGLPARPLPPTSELPQAEARVWRTRPLRPAPDAPRRRHAPWAVASIVTVLMVSAGTWWITRPEPAMAPESAPIATGDPARRSEPCEPGAEVVCADQVEIRSGVVDTGTERYAVGDPGDLVVVGDWDCDGSATAALLRPATGEVFVFDRWARTGEDLEVPAVTRLRGANTIHAVPTDQDCHRLAIGYHSGRWLYDSTDA